MTETLYLPPSLTPGAGPGVGGAGMHGRAPHGGEGEGGRRRPRRRQRRERSGRRPPGEEGEGGDLAREPGERGRRSRRGGGRRRAREPRRPCSRTKHGWLSPSFPACQGRRRIGEFGGRALSLSPLVRPRCLWELGEGPFEPLLHGPGLLYPARKCARL